MNWTHTHSLTHIYSACASEVHIHTPHQLFLCISRFILNYHDFSHFILNFKANKMLNILIMKRHLMYTLVPTGWLAGCCCCCFLFNLHDLNILFSAFFFPLTQNHAQNSTIISQSLIKNWSYKYELYRMLPANQTYTQRSQKIYTFLHTIRNLKLKIEHWMKFKYSREWRKSTQTHRKN